MYLITANKLELERKYVVCLVWWLFTNLCAVSYTPWGVLQSWPSLRDGAWSLAVFSVCIIVDNLVMNRHKAMCDFVFLDNHANAAIGSTHGLNLEPRRVLHSYFLILPFRRRVLQPRRHSVIKCNNSENSWRKKKRATNHKTQNLRLFISVQATLGIAFLKQTERL